MSTSDIRWYVKKAARWGFSQMPAVGSSSGTEPALRVLTYHGIGEMHRNPFVLGRRQFAQQMEYLARHRLAVSLDDLEDHLAGRRKVPRGAVVVTIDDGLRSLHHEALPILRDHDLPAVAFVTPGLLENNPAEASKDDPYLTWSQLEAVRAGGIEIGSHGFTHRSLGRLPASEAEDEISRSKAVLQQRLGSEVRAMAYPFGTRPDFNAGTRASLARAGYRFGFTSQHGSIVPGADPLVLARIKVEAGDSMSLFRRLTLGGLDSWRFVDSLLWRIQAS